MAKVRFGIYMEQERKDKADARARELGLTFNGLVNVALNEYLKQQNVVDMVDMMKLLQQENRNEVSP